MGLYELERFGLADLIRLSAELRAIGGTSLEEVSRSITALLHRSLRDERGAPACALVRVYKTHRFARLPAELRGFVRQRYETEPAGDVPCLTLMATDGDEPDWCDRRKSRSHQAIPIPGSDALRASPMVNALFSQLGLDAEAVLSSEAILVDPGQQRFNVFHVKDAAGSPYVPDQDFVENHGIRSVLGFGGLLPDGEMWAAILFSKVRIGAEVADLFRSVALSGEVAMVAGAARTFVDQGEPNAYEVGLLDQRRADALSRLLEVRESTVLRQTERLESTLRDLEVSQRISSANEARQAAILRSSIDGIVTIDAAGRIVEFNAAAEAMFGFRREQVAGLLMVDHIVPKRLREGHREGFARHLETGESRILNERIEITAVRANGEEFPVELTVTRVEMPGNEVMFSAHIRELTGVRRQEARLRELADALQARLLPPVKVQIPGLDVATEYRSARGFDGIVGGDFFDTFRRTGSTWSIAMGDVCGKGPAAASLTDLVRYTIRSGEIHHDDPTSTLREVNHIVVQDPDVVRDDRFCTAALLRLDLDGSGRASGRLALAGHPLPILVRASGSAEAVGGPAIPLGLFEEFEAAGAEFDLAPGDSVVIYTDGVTEARSPRREMFGVDRLVTSLSRRAGTGSAAELLDGLMADLKAFAPEPTDDIAVVVVTVSPSQISDNG